MMEHKLLLVDDDRDLLEMLCSIFRRAGYTDLVTASSGQEALQIWREQQPALIVLDVMMPGMDGFAVLREIRRTSRVPVLMLTARGEAEDRIEGLEIGADDYLPKPFDPDELLSRVRAILRRSEAYQPTVLAYGDLTLDPGSGNLSCGKDPIRLSGREFQIMELFMRSPRQVFSAERIMERVWGWDNEAEINVVWVNISNLRKKLKSIGSHVTLQANRGLGYVLEESV